MIYVALTLAAGIVVQTLAFTGLLLKQERRHSRRVDTLLDRLAHAAGRTWMPPPTDGTEQTADMVAATMYDPFQEPD